MEKSHFRWTNFWRAGHPEVRKLVFEALDQLDFCVHVVVARKLESVFETQHKRSPDIFYDDLIGRLISEELHLATHNVIKIAKRGNRLRQRPLLKAIEIGAKKFSEAHKPARVSVEISQPVQEPVLQAVDYAIWTVQRAYERRDMRYFEFLRERIEMVRDVFDFNKIEKYEPVNYQQNTKSLPHRKSQPD